MTTTLNELVDMDSTKKLTVEEKLALASKRRGTAAQPAAEQKSAPARLPLWPDAVCAIPNGFLRSALFGAIRKGQKNRRYINEELLASIDGIEVRYKGEQLDQSDLSTWATILHAVRLQELGTQCRITAYALLKMMGKTDTGKNRQTLHSRIMRLRANAVEIKQGKHTYIGGFVACAAKDENTQEWVIEIDPKIKSLFEPDQFTQIDWIIRHSLDGQQLAQWLHGFYASHANPFSYKIETIHKLCGSESESISDFKKDVKRNLRAVADAFDLYDMSFRYQIVGDLVHVEKMAQGAQRRHLAKQAAITTRKPRA